MPKKSKWENVEFLPGGFRSFYTPSFIIKVLSTVEESAYEAMMQNNRQLLIDAIKSIDFPTQKLSTGSFSGTLHWMYEIKEGLVHLTEMLWYRHAPTANCIETYAKQKNLPQKEVIGELCAYRAQRLRGDFTDAWRRLDDQIIEKLTGALDSLVEEVLAQTFDELSGSDLPLTRSQLYELAVSPEEVQRKKRMNAGRGGSTSEYNLRWFPQNYARAYQQLKQASQIHKDLRISKRKKERDRWRGLVKEEYPDLDDELIARLTGNPGDLTEEHLTRLGNKGGDSTPSDIALEQAARWCGIRRYLYTKRGLLKRLESVSNRERRAPTPGIYTFLLNWYRKGRRLTKTEIKEIFTLVTRQPKLRLPPELKRKLKETNSS